jgi:hypothetical protein
MKTLNYEAGCLVATGPHQQHNSRVATPPLHHTGLTGTLAPTCTADAMPSCAARPAATFAPALIHEIPGTIQQPPPRCHQPPPRPVHIRRRPGGFHLLYLQIPPIVPRRTAARVHARSAAPTSNSPSQCQP